MVKKLDWLIIRTFLGPFIVTFFVTLFVLVMQFFWLYMDELLGKGLPTLLILQLLTLMSSTLVPLALPLAVLMASIMAFGSMGEAYELVAIKSAGISLLRFMRPLAVVALLLSGVAFLFSNYVMPVANLRALSLLYDLRNSKPTFNIRAGQFNNDIKGFSILIGAKDKDGQTIRDIVIFDYHSDDRSRTSIHAKKGKMIPSMDGRSLTFRLEDGWRYEEVESRDERKQNEQRRMHFGRYDKIFDLSEFKISRTRQELFQGDQKMMSVELLSTRIDSMRRDKKRLGKTVQGYLNSYVTLGASGVDSARFAAALNAAAAVETYPDSTFLQTIPDTMRLRTVQAALGSVRNAGQLVNITATTARVDEEKFLKFRVERHKKFTLSVACFLLFLLGAPLGSIIRKGGVGLPLLWAIIFFIIWYILSFSGEKLSTSGALMPVVGMWMSTILLLPLAFFLIGKARADSPVFTREWYARRWAAIRPYLPFARKRSA